MNTRILSENRHLPGDFERQIEALVKRYNHDATAREGQSKNH
jgi:hypothetical protein